MTIDSSINPANPRIVTINGGLSSIKCALFEVADLLDMFTEIEETFWQDHQVCGLSSLSGAILLSRRTKGKNADEVDGGSMKRTVKMTPMLLDMDGMQLRSVSGMAGSDLFRKQGRIGA